MRSVFWVLFIALPAWALPPLTPLASRAFQRDLARDGVPLRRAPAPARAQFRGTVVPSSRGLMLQNRPGRPLMLTLTPGTRVEPGALEPGADVRASFDVAGPVNVARTVTLTLRERRRTSSRAPRGR